MRLKLLVLCSTSTLVLTAAPALAQAGLPATPPTAGQGQTASPAAPAQAQDNQNSPAGGTPGAAQDAAASDATAASDADALNATGGDVVVTGLRRSLESAQNIKRNSDQQVDSIVASDIGKLPDVAISDTAARIPGVQVDRSGGEASRVLVRGLPDFATTYNGREIFTAEARSVALQDFPAGAISAIEVFKTTTADLVEGGLAGEVNVRSRKPFDFDRLEVAGSFWGQYEKRSKKFNPNGNLLISDRWNTGIGEIGALINFSYTSLDYLDSTRSNTDFIATNLGGTGANAPDIQRVTFGEGKRVRPSLNGALQWRPAPGVELYAEGLWQGFRNSVSDRETSINLYSGSAYNNVTLVPGTNLIDTVTVTNPRRPDGFQGATHQTTNTYQYAVGGKFGEGPLRATVDVAHTISRFVNSVYSFDTAWAAPATVTANTGLTSSVGPFLTFGPGTDPTSAANYIYRGFFDRQQVARGKDWQGRIDVTYDTGVSGMPTLEAGFRYVDRDAHYEDGSRYSSREGEALPLSAVPVDYAVSSSGFPSDNPSGLRGYYTPTYDSIRANIDQLRAFSGFPSGTPPIDPLATYSSTEKSYAFYGQAKFLVGNPDGFRVDGTVGMRVVSTELGLVGTSVSGSVSTPNNLSTNYWDWLPNANARVHFTDKMQLRLSATKTRSRPGFGQYNPSATVGSPLSCQIPGNSGYISPSDPNAYNQCFRTGSIGNPDLRPLTSKNYDASLEWYPTRTATASVAVFRRDLNGFISNYLINTTDEQGYRVQLSQPFNTGKGRIQGAEAQFTTFLDFGGLPTWLRSFGIDSNVTYLDAKTGIPSVIGGPVTQTQIAGVSKWTYNVAGIFEHGGLSTRLSWNHRGSYLATYQPRGADIYTETVRGISRLDFSGSYDLFKNLTLTVDATNILAKPFRSDLTYDYANGTSATFPRFVRYEESVYSAGFRFRF